METSHKKRHTSTHHQDSRFTIGMLAHTVSSSGSLIEHVVEVAMEHGVNLLHVEGGLVNSLHGFESQANIMYNLIDKEIIDGLIIEGVIFHYAGSEEMKHLCERYAPLPMVTQEVPITGIPRTYVDFYQGMYDILMHLIEEHGYRRIAFIRGPQESITAEERYRAYRDALTHAGIPLDERLVAPGTFFAPSGVEAVHTLLDTRQLCPGTDIQAIAAVNDFTAFDVVETLQRRGIRVPEEVAVTGFDNEEVCYLTTPSLTTVRMPLDEVGRPLVELLLDQFAGRSVPEQVILPAKVILRESCGCLDRAMAQAAVINTDGHSDQPFEVAVANRRTSILAALMQVGGEIGQDMPVHWAEQLLDAFIQHILGNADMEADAGSHFWVMLDELFRQATVRKKDMALWHDVFSELRRHLLPCLSDPNLLARAENLWQQIRVKISRHMERVQRRQQFQAAQQAQTLREIEQRLLITFHIEELMDVLAEELPRVNIQECYLALYEDPQPYEYPQTAPIWSRLVLAYNSSERIQLPAGGQRFRSGQILPDPLLCRETPYALDVWPLYFREAQLGFIVFDIRSLHSRSIYNALREQISNALQGALLVQQIEEHDAELTRKQYILDSFMENIPDRIYFKDREGRITRANTAHARRLGLKMPEEEIGKTDFDFFPDDEAKRKWEQEQEILRAGRPLLNIEECAPGADNQLNWSLTTKMPLRDERGEIIGTFGISRDITALKQAEHELRQYRDHLEDLVRKRTAELTRSNARLHEEIIERRRVEEELTRSNARLHDEIIERRRIEHVLRVSEQQYRVLAENVKDGIVIVQHEKLVFANMISATITGYPPEHLIEIDPVSLFQVTDKQSLHAWLKVGSDGSPEPQRQVELITRDGNTIWTEIVRSEIVWNGQPAILLTIRDITDRKLREQHLEEERVRLQQENISLRSTIKERYRFGALVGKSPAMQRVYELILSAATSDVNVLVYGESGTGKELIARTLHQLSWRKTQAFVPVNCASIPETLFEREFFGHHKGAFTGADRDKSGLFDRAHQGILFLDEVTELSPGAQAKLLRVLQDGEYTPLGSNTPKQADVLLVAATNKEYQMEIKQGRLRKDFFYRICVIEISVPPLQERKEDLPLLIEFILEQYRRKQAQVHGSVPLDLPADQTMLPGEFIQALYAYHWPGNVRELQNVLQRYLATRDLNTVLPSLGASADPRRSLNTESIPDTFRLSDALQTLEKRMIAKALAHTCNHRTETAKILGISRRSLHYKLAKYGLL